MAAGAVLDVLFIFIFVQYWDDDYNTIQYNEKFALKNWQTHCQFNLAHKLKRTELFKRKMKW